MLRFLYRFVRWCETPKRDYVSVAWLVEHSAGAFDDNPRARATR